MEPAAAMASGELDAALQAAADFASYPGMHGDDTVRQFLEQFPLPKLLGALQNHADVPGLDETVSACLDKVFSSRYGASLLPSYGAFIQAGLVTNSKNIRQLACKAVLHLLDRAGDSVAVDTIVQHNLYPLLINCLIEGDEEISAIALDVIKRLAEVPKGIDIIFPPDGQGSMQLNKVAAQSSSMARIRILSLIAKLFAVSSYTATAIRESNLLSLFEDEIKDRKDMLRTLSALEVLYELVIHPHSNIFLLKTNLLQLITDMISDSSTVAIVRSRAALISGRLLSSADAFVSIDKSCVSNLLLVIDGILKIEEGQNTDEIEVSPRPSSASSRSPPLHRHTRQEATAPGGRRPRVAQKSRDRGGGSGSPAVESPSLQMDSHNSSPPNISEVTVDISSASGAAGNKICRGAACDFADTSNTSKDAKERAASMRKLLIAVILCVIFMAVEVVGGIKANSLAILTDAAHLLSDVAAFAISLFSLWAAGWEATPQQSYGFFRIEILGALVSIQLIWLLAGILVYEAIVRLINESGEVQGSLMFAVSAFGLFVNIIMAVLLGHDHGHGHGHGHEHSHDHDHGNSDEHHEQDHVHHQGHGHGTSITVTTHHHSHSSTGQHQDVEEPLLKYDGDCDSAQSGAKAAKKPRRNINVHSAYLHVIGDSIQSIGVMIGGGLIWYKPEWKIIDLICTLIFSVIVLFTTIKMIRNILEVLMESTPREIDATRLESGLREMEGVVAVHELHIWAITVGKVLLACHVTITQEANADQMLDKVIGYIKAEYNISHVTIQIERE